MAWRQEIERALVEFRRDGVCTIPGAFRPSEVDDLRLGIFETLIGVSQPRRYRDGGAIRWIGEPGSMTPSLVFWPALVNPRLNEARVDPRMQTLVTRFVGVHARQLVNQVYLRLPGDCDSFAWHQDIMFRASPDAFPDVEHSYLQTMIAIDDVTEENGAIAFLRGSHRLGRIRLDAETPMRLRHYDEDGLPEAARRFERYVPDLRSGDMLLWNALVVHASKPNRSSRTRMTYMNGFCATGHARDWPVYLEDGKVRPVIEPAAIPRDD